MRIGKNFPKIVKMALCALFLFAWYPTSRRSGARGRFSGQCQWKAGRCRVLNTVDCLKIGHGHNCCRTVWGLSLYWGWLGAPLSFLPAEWSSGRGYNSGAWPLANVPPPTCTEASSSGCLLHTGCTTGELCLSRETECNNY